MSAEARAGLSLVSSNFSSGIGGAIKDVDRLKGAFGKLALAAGALIGVTSAGVAIGKAFDGIKDALDFGGELTDMTARTGIAVDSLVILQQAFEAAGLGADDVGPAVARMQRALAGVNEDGQDTTSVFARLGLKIQDLKKLSPDKQLDAVGRKIAQIQDPADRASAAMQIFGKSGAQLLSVFRDPEAISNSAAYIGKQAEILARDAAQFDAASDIFGGLWKKKRGFFVGVADSLLPEITKASQYLANLDLAPLGQNVGATIANAFRTQETDAAIVDVAGKFIRVMSAATQSLGEIIAAALTSAFSTPIAYFQAAIEKLVEDQFSAAGHVDAFALNSQRAANNVLSSLARKVGLNSLADAYDKETKGLETRAKEAPKSATIEERKNRIMQEGGPQIGIWDPKTAAEHLAAALERIKDSLKSEFTPPKGLVPPRGTPAPGGAPFVDSADALRKSSLRLVVSSMASVGGGGRVYDPGRSVESEAKKQTKIVEREELKRTNIMTQYLKAGVIRVDAKFA